MNSCVPPHVFFIQPVKPNAFFLVLALSLQFLAAEKSPFLHSLSDSSALFSRQILMSARCPPRAPGERVQTRRAPSCVSHVSLVLRCLRMDSGVKVRLSAVFVQKSAFVAPNRCVFVWLPPLEIAHKGECAAVNGIRCKRYDLKAHAPPPSLSEPKIPKYLFQTSHHSWIVDPSTSGTIHSILAQHNETPVLK